MSSNCGTDKARRGFSLMELAIVLGIMGIVLATLWGVVTIVRERIDRGRAVNQIAMTVRNVRDFYLGRALIANSAGSGDFKPLTSYLLEQSVLPPEMIRTRTGVSSGGFLADHPWGTVAADGSSLGEGGFAVCSAGTCKTSDASSVFTIELRGLKKASCAYLATAVSGVSGPDGLKAVYLNNGSSEKLPVTAERAIEGCSNVSNTLDFAFRLRTRE